MIVEGTVGALLTSTGVFTAAQTTTSDGDLIGQLAQGGIAAIIIAVGAWFLARSDRRERELAEQYRQERDTAHEEHLALQAKYQALLERLAKEHIDGRGREGHQGPEEAGR